MHFHGVILHKEPLIPFKAILSISWSNFHAPAVALTGTQGRHCAQGESELSDAGMGGSATRPFRNMWRNSILTYGVGV